MMKITHRANNRRALERSALTMQFPGLQPKPQPLPPLPFDRSAIVAGRNQGGAPVLLSERARLEHAHVLGTTGGGKTKYLEHCIRQDIADGRGVCVVDPHGEHPGSLYRSVLSWVQERGYARSRTVHLFDPNASTHAIGFNPLARPEPETDLSVIAGVTLEAFSRAWGGEDTSEKPTIERVLTATFTALAELGLTLAEAPLLYDRTDRHGLRAWAAATVKDRFAREELQRLHELSLDERRRGDFDKEVVGPINRIARFVRPDAIRTMIGQTDRQIDLRHAMDNGDIILVNLSGGSRVYERDADLLGRLITRFIFFHAKRRLHPERAFFVYLDECQRYLSGDLENLLAEARKFGVGFVLANQWLTQIATESDNMLAAVRSATNVKVVFRLKDPVEAEDVALAVVPLDLEMPVAKLIKPSVIGHRLTKLSSASESDQFAETAMSSVSRGKSWSETSSHTVSHSETDATGVSHGESSGSTSSENTGSSNSLTAGEGTSTTTTESLSADPSLTGGAALLGLSQATGSSAQSARTSGTTRGVSRGNTVASTDSYSSSHAVSTGESWGESVSHGLSRSKSKGTATTRGGARSQGTSDAFEAIMADLPSAVHGKENVLYMAAQTLRNLTAGMAFINFVDHRGMQAALLTVPHVADIESSAHDFELLRMNTLERSPSSIRLPLAQQSIVEREVLLIAQAQQAGSLLEPENPSGFRTKRVRNPTKDGEQSVDAHGQQSAPTRDAVKGPDRRRRRPKAALDG